MGRFKKALKPKKEIKNAPRRSGRYKVKGRIPCKRLETLQISLGIMLSPHSTSTLPSFIMIANAMPNVPTFIFIFPAPGFILTFPGFWGRLSAVFKVF
tara:strand:- start:2236 stop:2529 length:294 start_codon:yes stop_codon:yes gene_type:complete